MVKLDGDDPMLLRLGKGGTAAGMLHSDWAGAWGAGRGGEKDWDGGRAEGGLGAVGGKGDKDQFEVEGARRSKRGGKGLLRKGIGTS